MGRQVHQSNTNVITKHQIESRLIQLAEGKGSFLEMLCHNAEMKINLLTGHEIIYKQDPGLSFPFWLCACSIRKVDFIAFPLHTGKAPVLQFEESVQLLCSTGTGADS